MERPGEDFACAWVKAADLKAAVADLPDDGPVMVIADAAILHMQFEHADHQTSVVMLDTETEAR